MGHGSLTNGNGVNNGKGEYLLLKDTEKPQLGLFDQPLPCCGCGIGWFSFLMAVHFLFSFLLGFVFPVMWYYATILYFGNYYQRDPRERAGLAASAIAALVCTITVFITLAVIFL